MAVWNDAALRAGNLTLFREGVRGFWNKVETRYSCFFLLQQLDSRPLPAKRSSGHKLPISACTVVSMVMYEDVAQSLFTPREINQMKREMQSPLYMQSSAGHR